jgi:hypothetical protein
MKRILIVAVALLLAGCSVNPTFVYKPSAPAWGVQKLPVKVAVVAFQDGTGDETMRMTPSGPSHVNLANTGIEYRIDAQTTDLWAMAFAKELAASGAFQAVRFVYGAAEAREDELVIEGIVTRADLAISGAATPDRLSLGLTARRTKQGGVFWEKTVSRERTQGYMYKCGLSWQCYSDTLHAYYNKLLTGMFREAGQDLAAALARGGGNERSGESGNTGSADDTIEGILKGK